ncbi:MAG: translation initiation factor IF-2 N-terminal domain-containing protein [Acidimicrobiales bacterium]|nr:translation initiation factor IF-2 N-terminal domain-containing protein [Acidimicrobiales bacterium]
MPGNIRVYELARELGLTNKETLDLCVALGIGVKSHSSSVVEAQADRVRRKAEREGLIRDEQPEEPSAKKPAKKAAAKKAAEPPPAAEAAAPVEAETSTPAPEVAPAPAPESPAEVTPPAPPAPP